MGANSTKDKCSIINVHILYKLENSPRFQDISGTWWLSQGQSVLPCFNWIFANRNMAVAAPPSPPLARLFPNPGNWCWRGSTGCKAPIYPISRQDKFVIPDLDLEIVGACEDVCNICSCTELLWVAATISIKCMSMATVWLAMCAPATNKLLFISGEEFFLAQQDFDTSWIVNPQKVGASWCFDTKQDPFSTPFTLFNAEMAWRRPVWFVFYDSSDSSNQVRRHAWQKVTRKGQTVAPGVQKPDGPWNET